MAKVLLTSATHSNAQTTDGVVLYGIKMKMVNVDANRSQAQQNKGSKIR